MLGETSCPRQPLPEYFTNVASSATPTGLEPATFRVTGGRSNQLSYGAIRIKCYLTTNAILTQVYVKLYFLILGESRTS